MESFDTIELKILVERHQSGDRLALNQLIRHTEIRLERLAERMLSGYPLVKSREETADVLQNFSGRLDRALSAVVPNSVQDYFGLAAALLRRELLDLSRYHARRPGRPDCEALAAREGHSSVDLDKWTHLHAAVQSLPPNLRKVFELKFYNGCTQEQIAEVLDVTERQVRRLWAAAVLRLYELSQEKKAEE